MTDDWVTVVPGTGEVKAVAILLLALADDPLDVRTRSNGSEFVVRPYVAERFTQPDPAPTRRNRSKKGAQ